MSSSQEERVASVTQQASGHVQVIAAKVEQNEGDGQVSAVKEEKTQAGGASTALPVNLPDEQVRVVKKEGQAGVVGQEQLLSFRQCRR